MQDAEKTYEQLTKGLNKKLKAQDKAAIVTWLKMIDAEQYARNARVLGKVFTGVDWAIKGADLVNAAIEGFSTGNWKAFRNQLEAFGLSIGAGYTLSAIAAFSRRRWCRRRWAFSPSLTCLAGPPAISMRNVRGSWRSGSLTCNGMRGLAPHFTPHTLYLFYTTGATVSSRLAKRRCSPEAITSSVRSDLTAA